MNNSNPLELPKELSLAERLSLFDPELHGGEAMATVPVGREIVAPPKSSS